MNGIKYTEIRSRTGNVRLRVFILLRLKGGTAKLTEGEIFAVYKIMNWVSTTENESWSEKNRLSDKTGSVLVIGEKIGKPIYGWGCCISEICAKAIFGLPKEEQRVIFDELFGEDGCGFDYCRLSIGANDFAESWYSYNEHDGDYGMEHFSIERDKKYIIPAIREAKRRSPGLMLFASPWSPPTWMKFPKVCNFGKLVQTEENLKAYALYFRKFIEAYADEGIKISQIMPQNEYFSDQKFPSCVYTEEELENFIANYLIDEIGDIADVWFGTTNGPDPSSEYGTHNGFLNKIMQNEKCRKHIKGAAYQWCGKYSIMQAWEDFPELDFIHSECQCGDGENTWEYAMYTYEMIHHYFRFGARANVYWNMALENDGLSTWGWRQNSLISVKDGEYRFNPEFYCIKHFSHFVKRGAVMLRTKGDFSSNTSIFENPDGSRIAVIMNPFEKEKVLTVEGKNYILKPKSFNSIILG